MMVPLDMKWRKENYAFAASFLSFLLIFFVLKDPVPCVLPQLISGGISRFFLVEFFGSDFPQSYPHTQKHRHSKKNDVEEQLKIKYKKWTCSGIDKRFISNYERILALHLPLFQREINVRSNSLRLDDPTVRLQELNEVTHLTKFI